MYVIISHFLGNLDDFPPNVQRIPLLVGEKNLKSFLMKINMSVIHGKLIVNFWYKFSVNSDFSLKQKAIEDLEY